MFRSSGMGSCLAVLLGLALFVEDTDAQYWSRWRGPTATGSTASGNYPVKWNAHDHLNWKVELPGRGCSTPIVWRDHILVSTATGDRNGLLALDWSGKTLWRTTFGPLRKGRHRNGSGANPSPVTDGKLIFVYYKSGRLGCVDFDGKTLWSTNLQERFGLESSTFRETIRSRWRS